MSTQDASNQPPADILESFGLVSWGQRVRAILV